MKFHVFLKKPFGRSTIWAGPEHQLGILPTHEDDKAKTRREAVGNRLEHLVGEKPAWNKRTYAYTVDVTPDQAAEIAAWPNVRRVEEV